MEINTSSNVNAMAYQLMESNIRLSQQAAQQAQASVSAQGSDNSAAPVAATQQSSAPSSTGGINTYA